jgi:ribosomal protein S18 acetylase RimI-like enzyme
VDESLNPDLDDIGETYSQGTFVVGWAGPSLVGTGGFLPRSESTIQIHRVSVALELRRTRVGSAIVAHLLGVARARAFERAILETTETWTEVVSFYERLGFEPYERRDGNIYLGLDLGVMSAEHGR